MARLYEYQGKEVLATTGISVPQGKSADSAKEARQIAEGIGKPIVIKAQIWATGRFKAGGIKFASSPAEAEEAAKALIGAEIKGLKVERVLIEAGLSCLRPYGR